MSACALAASSTTITVNSFSHQAMVATGPETGAGRAERKGPADPDRQRPRMLNRPGLLGGS